MFKLTLLVVLATTGFFQLTTGSPAASIPSRRDSSEGVYLSNCNVVDAGILYSEMDFYSNAKAGSQNGQQPDDTTDAIQPMNAYVAWEGNQVCGTFINSGETFCSNIVSNGQSLVSLSMVCWLVLTTRVGYGCIRWHWFQQSNPIQLLQG